MSKIQYRFIPVLIAMCFFTFQCPEGKMENLQQELNKSKNDTKEIEKKILPGSYIIDEYLPLLKGKKVGVVCNHTALIEHTHLVDTLLRLGIDINKIFAPEHGFRGEADAGFHISDARDSATGLPIISLYGKNKKPSQEQLQDVNVVLFDMQDVGCRFYTYLSTLHYVMEACAEANIPLILLDRPNPNGFYVDGPVLKPGMKSFVGMHPIPVVHGMTLGELAGMINGEKWLHNKLVCSLKVITCKNYTHQDKYTVPVPPSPNLRTMNAIYLYPSLCFFEGTPVSVGRGTPFPFEVFGHPALVNMPDTFTPLPAPGAKNPPLKGQLCHGRKLTFRFEQPFFTFQYVIDAYNSFPEKDKFFNKFFDLLTGDPAIKSLIKQGKSDDELRKYWEKDIAHFLELRQKYLLYP